MTDDITWSGTSAYRILVTGSREWKSKQRIKQALTEQVESCLAHGIRPLVLIHGGARGADSLAQQVWLELMVEHAHDLLPAERHDAKWRLFGSAAGPMRNTEMVNAGADICLAFPLGRSSGTRDCMRKAEAAGIMVITYRGSDEM